MPEIVIGICTFRRAHLAQTLRSCAGLVVPEGWQLTVVVADNDDRDSARARVADFAQQVALPVVYLHAPARNISTARNAILAQAAGLRAARLAFLDDDETVPPGWLKALFTRMDETGAAVVLGPVRADYCDDAPHWLRQGRLHDTEPVAQGDGTIRTGYTCNVLMDLTVPVFDQARFDLRLGQTGGEDTLFFHQIWAAGGRFAFAPDAPAHEVVPPNRASLRWLLQRRYRMGQTHGQQLAQGRTRLARVGLVAKAAAKALACLCLALANLGRRDRAAHHLMRAALHLGVVSYLGGGRLIKPYGNEILLKPWCNKCNSLASALWKV